MSDPASTEPTTVPRRICLMRVGACLMACGAIIGALCAAGLVSVEGETFNIRIPGRAIYPWRPTWAAGLLLVVLVAIHALPRGTTVRGLEVAGWAFLVLQLGIGAQYPSGFTAGAVVCVVGFAWWVHWRTGGLAALLDRWPRHGWAMPGRRVQVILAGCLVLLLGALGWWVHGGVPYVVDTAAELFHARILQQGRFVAPAPPLPEFFWLGAIYCGPGGWYSQYTPAHMVWIALADLMGLAGAVNAVFAGGILLLTWRVADRLHGPAVGCWSAALLVASPYFIQIQSGSMSHGSSAFFLLLALWKLIGIGETPRPLRDAAVMGMALGLAFITRPLTAVGFMAPMIVWGAIAQLPRLPRPWLALGAALAAASVPVGWQLIFNWQCNGSPFVNSYGLVHPEYVQYGFNESLPFMQGVAHVLNNLHGMNLYLFGLPTGSFLLVLLLLVGGRPNRRDGLLLAIAVGLSLAYMPYHYQDGWYGPRFLYEALPLLVILSARGVMVLLGWVGAVQPGAVRVAGFFVLATMLGWGAAFATDRLTRIHDISINQQRPIMAAVMPHLGDPGALIFVGGIYDYTVAPLNAEWQRGALFALDMGIEENRRLVEAMPDRPRAMRYDDATKSLIAWDAGLAH